MKVQLKEKHKGECLTFKDLSDWEYFRWPDVFNVFSKEIRLKIPLKSGNAFNTINLTKKDLINSSINDSVVRLTPEELEFIKE